MMVDVLYYLKRVLNFTVELKQSNGYGSLLGNGTWTGGIGMILAGDADFAINEFSITYERQPYL